MVYTHLRPSLTTRRAMSNACIQLGKNYISHKDDPIKSSLEEKINKMLLKKHVHITSGANAAIFAALALAEKKICIPDMGGWHSYKTYPAFLGKEIVEIPTLSGIISPDQLDITFRREVPDMILLSSFAGYMAEQPMREIKEICNQHNVLLVEDISGSIGSSYPGEYADIVICSTGAMKMANVLSGGFIAFNNKNYISQLKVPLSISKTHPAIVSGMVEELCVAKQRYETLLSLCKRVKKECLRGEVMFEDAQGIIVGFNLIDTIFKPKDMVRLAQAQKFMTDLHSPLIMAGPRYDRATIPCITLELKKIDVLHYDQDKLLEMLLYDLKMLFYAAAIG